VGGVLGGHRDDAGAGRVPAWAHKYAAGWILDWTFLLTGPVSAIVYTLGGLGVAETFLGDPGRPGPWFMAVRGVVLTACAPGALRRTRLGMAAGRTD